jgi:hypothetical protein
VNELIIIVTITKIIIITTPITIIIARLPQMQFCLISSATFDRKMI